jgi:hypothetical protein
MGVVGDTFVMGLMALSAISTCLVAMAEFRAVRMADHTGQIRMGGCFVLPLIYQWIGIPLIAGKTTLGAVTM